VPAYLGMSYLYKRANWLWPLLIRHRLTAKVWRPLVEYTRQRHVKFRARLEDQRHEGPVSVEALVSAGV